MPCSRPLRTALSGRARRWWPIAVALPVLVAALLVMGRGSSSPRPIPAAEVEDIVERAVGEAIDDLRSGPANAAQVYAAIHPSLVLIRSSGDEVFGEGSGLGTGVVINDQGAILTSFHVVAEAPSLLVTFADGTESPATIQSSDPDNDIAVLGAARLPEVVVPAILGGGGNVGDDAIVVGHPLGLVGSLTAGVISGLDRSIPTELGGTLRGLIQFDAAVNPGSSGGPLLDRSGRVIGIVTALADPSEDGYFIGVGFAVPIATAGGAAGAPPR